MRLTSTSWPSAAVDVAVVERHHHGVGGGHGGHPVGQHERGEGRRPVRLAGQVGEAAHGLGQGAEAGAVALGAAAAVAAHVEHDDPGVVAVDRLVVEMPALEGARPVVGDEHVAHRQEPVEELLAVGHPQVEGHAPLVAVDALPDQADVTLALAPRAQRVADAGLLDLDHLGPELPEGGGHHRPGGQGGGVDHPEPLEGPRGLSHRRPPTAGGARACRAAFGRGSGSRNTPRRWSSGTTIRTTSS